MNIVLVNTSARKGGAATAANRLKQALSACDEGRLSVCLLTNDEDKHKAEFWAYARARFRFFFDLGVIFFANHFSKKGLFRISIAKSGQDISRLPEIKNADLIHLHWINQGFLSLRSLHRLQKLNKPIVWTLHDLWPATGICHYPGDCTAYRTACHTCPQMTSQPWLPLARRVFRKKSQLDFSKTTFVGCSEWIKQMAQESALLKGAQFVSIPNPIDTALYHPIDRHEARQQFNLPLNRQIILFVADRIADPRKGMTFLVDACQQLYQKGLRDFDIALLGRQSEDLSPLFPCPVHPLGYLSDPKAIRAAYAAANLFVIPSLEDNLPNTIMESLSCGTPCVGFRIGGIPEMIDHLQNGYLARAKDPQDLSEGIAWVLQHPNPDTLSAACLRKVDTHYRQDLVAKRYEELYRDLIKGERP